MSDFDRNAFGIDYEDTIRKTIEEEEENKKDKENDENNKK